MEMPIPNIRIRKENFGYTLAFADGHIGFYKDEIAELLLHGTTRAALEQHRLEQFPVGDRFRLQAPLIVWFEITRSCNLPCKHCYINAGRPRSNELSTVEIFSVLDQLKAAGVFALVLVGGEPMRHPDFIKILHYAHELGFVLSIATNGTYLTKEIIAQIPQEECVVSVSLDGTDFHNEIRVTSTFDDIKQRLLLLKESGIPAAIMATQTDRNVRELQILLELAKENDFFFGSTPFSPIGRGALFPQYVPKTDIVDEAAQIFIADKQHDIKMMDSIGLCVAKFLDECHRVARATRREFCGVAMAYVTSDGQVYPCSICASNNKFVAGNLRETGFEDIWEHSFLDIRSYTFDKFKDCSACEMSAERYNCTSRCPVMAELYTGDPLGCGATPYVKASLKRRTELLEATFPS